MNLKRMSFITIALSMVLTLSVTAKPKQLLRLNLAKGDVYEMTMSVVSKIDQELEGTQVKMDQNMKMVMELSVDDLLDNGNFSVSYKYKVFNISMSGMGQSMRFSSEDTDENNPMFPILRKLTTVTLKMELTPKGSVVKVEDFDQYANMIGGNPQLSSVLAMFSNEDAFKSNLGQTFNYFPEDEIRVSDTWKASVKMPALMNMDIKMVFTATGISKDVVDLSVDSKINSNANMDSNGMNMNLVLDGTQKGIMQINPEDGMITKSNVEQVFAMTMKMKNPQSGKDMEIPMKLNSTVEVTAVKK